MSVVKRSSLLSGFLVLVVLSHWIISFFFFKRLPLKFSIPLGGEPAMFDKPLFFLFPALTTLLALLVLLLSKKKEWIPFFGKKETRGLPAPFSLPVYDRAYQVVVMTTLFVIMLVVYFQMAVALHSTSVSTKFDISALYTVAPIILVYLGFNLYLLSRMARAARENFEGEEQDI